MNNSAASALRHLPRNRRVFLQQAAGIPALLSFDTCSEAAMAAAQIKPGGLKVVCVGGHPDDPESSCGGTLATYASRGHRVTIVYLTRGERGIPGKYSTKPPRSAPPKRRRRASCSAQHRCSPAKSTAPPS